MITNPPSGADFVEIDYEVEKEDWNVYELSDGSILRLRSVLIKLAAPKGSPVNPPVMAGGFQTLQAVKAHQRMKGPPAKSQYSIQELEKMRKTDVGFTTTRENWNEYRLSDGTRIRVKLNLGTVHRVEGLYDNFGDPVYLTTTTNAIMAVPKT